MHDHVQGMFGERPNVCCQTCLQGKLKKLSKVQVEIPLDITCDLAISDDRGCLCFIL